MKIVHFDLDDADGQSHTYQVELFSVAENVRLQLIVGQPLIKGVVRLVAALAPVFGKVNLEEIQDTASFAKALGHVDWNEAPDALVVLMEMVEKQGGPDLVTRVFDRTVRLLPIPEAAHQPQVGNTPVPRYIEQELRDPAVQDEVFGDANYQEYWTAFVMVLLVNFTRYGRTGSPSWRAGLERLTGGLLKQSRNETAGPSADSPSGNAQPMR